MAKLTRKVASKLSKALSGYIQQPRVIDCLDTEALAELMHKAFPEAECESLSIQIYRELIVEKLLEIED